MPGCVRAKSLWNGRRFARRVDTAAKTRTLHVGTTVLLRRYVRDHAGGNGLHANVAAMIAATLTVWSYLMHWPALGLGQNGLVVSRLISLLTRKPVRPKTAATITAMAMLKPKRSPRLVGA